MEKDQNINSESQNEEIKETEAEEQIHEEHGISAETEEVNEVTPEEKIKELFVGFSNIKIDRFNEGNFPRKLFIVQNQKK